MVALSNFCRKTFRKVDLRLAHQDGTVREGLQREGQAERKGDQHRPRLATAPSGDLTERMTKLGLGPDTIEALRYAPIAAVAWASGRVTEREHVIAVTPLLTSDLFHEPEAVQKFREWLSKRPSADLMALWEDFMTDSLMNGDLEEEQGFGQHLHQLATRIALASGGLLDQGDICVGEQRILDRIARVYSLSEVAA